MTSTDVAASEPSHRSAVQPVVIHAHFYQPERVNPWTGVLDPEASAAPDRDWNERIHRECYRPNAVARIFDDHRRVLSLVNNYERLSFNMGPTLLAWMERAEPDTYARILDADWRSSVRTGHGNAMAQAYNHVIMPLANDRDLRTQIRWGQADFRHRFSRSPEGMWLPETAADRRVVDALIDAGVRYTVLAPHQAKRVRHRGGDWHVLQGPIDTTRPYRHAHSDGSGRSLAIFFYDAALSQSLAFDPSTHDATVLVDRLLSGTGSGLVHAAVDGETFGHHHAFGELGLAYALTTAGPARGLTPTNYGAYLAAHAPVDDVELHDEPTAWSCAHGVGRWTRDCGCSTDALPGWDQRWRTPLRSALDVVRDAAVDAFARQGHELLRDPWSARDDYVNVRLGRTTPQQFLRRHGRSTVNETTQTRVWSLLEAQRHAMTMYTSCGWFFADVSGIETVYVLRSAARVLDLLTQVGAHAPREEMLEHLATASSNKPDVGTAAAVWRAQVEPAAISPWRIAAHLALVETVHPPLAAQREVAGHRVTVSDLRHEHRGQLALTTMRVHLTSIATARTNAIGCAALHLGGLDVTGALMDATSPVDFAEASAALWGAYPTASLGELLRVMTTHFDADDFGLAAALPEGEQQIAAQVAGRLDEAFSDAHRHVYTTHRRQLEMLAAAGYELPRSVRVTVELALTSELEELVDAALAAPAEESTDRFQEVSHVLERARSHGYALDLEPLRASLTHRVTEAAGTASASLETSDADDVDRWLDLSSLLGVTIDTSRAQEAVYDVAARARSGRLSPAQTDVVRRLGERLGLAEAAWSR